MMSKFLPPFLIIFCFTVTLDKTSLLPREAAGAVSAEELEGVPGVGEAARLLQARPRAARALSHCLRTLRGVLDEGMSRKLCSIYRTFLYQ